MFTLDMTLSPTQPLMRRLYRPFTLALALVMALTIGTGAASAQAAEGLLTNADAKTIEQVAGSKLATASPAVTDYNLAAQTSTIDVPLRSSAGVVLTKAGRRIEVTLPGASRDAKGSRSKQGVVLYDGTRSKDAVVPTADGAQFLTVIEDRSAPTQFSYKVDVPTGGTIRVGEANGVAAVVDAGGNPVAVIEAPWAKDARGTSVPTYFSTNGKTLTQHVLHTQTPVKYPVVADPYFHWYWNGAVVTLSRDDMAAVAYGGTEALIGLIAVPGIGWATLGGIAWVSVYSAWAYQNNQCFWFWLPPMEPTRADWGFYQC